MSIRTKNDPGQYDLRRAKSSTRLRRFRLGKSGLLLGAALSLLLVPGTWAQTSTNLPFYESFPTNYNENENLGAAGTSGIVWTYGNSVSSSSARVVSAAAQSYPGLQTADPSSSRGIRSNGVGKNRGAPFDPAVTNQTMYASFLLNLRATAAGNRIIFALSSSTTGTGPAVGAGVWLDGSGRLLISKNSNTTPDTTVATSPLILSNTYLVVIRYQVNPDTDDDAVSLWLNPLPFGNDSNIPAPTISTTNGTDAATFRSVAYMAPTGSPTPSFYMDEIRAGLNWSDVTPTSCSPGNTYNVTGGGTICGTGSFPVGLDGSDLGVDYWLFTNGIYASTVPGTGSAITFGPQATTAFYTVVGSNTTSGCTAYMAGSASVAIKQPPAIVTQPIAANAVSGSQVSFSVQASGDDLTYQWRRNGTNLIDGGSISGSATPNLIIYPVGTGDVVSSANGYDVVVNGTCPPSAVSTRVGLALKAASNLSWVGDGISNLWDIATTANWSSGGSPAVFNFGDNVTFDDTAGAVTVMLASSFLSPSTVTVNSGQVWGFGGSGSISGPSTTLTMGGGGILNMNSLNTYGGGTRLNSGEVTISSGSALGTGPITFAGGTLNINTAVTLENAVNLTSDGLIKVTNTSSTSLILNGPLGGTGGTLTIANNSPVNTAQNNSPTIRLASTNFTFNRPIVLDNVDYAPAPPQTSTNFYLAFYNGSGDQVFNGVISSVGNGQLQRRQSGGNTVLNAQNTYTGGTLLRGGGLGFGVSSISTVPPTIDSGPIGTSDLVLDVAGAISVYAVGGPRTIANPIHYLNSTAGSTLTFTGSNDLTFSGTFDLTGTNQTVQVDNTGRSIFSGVITNGGLIKTGSGTLYLNGANVYTGPTTVSAGALGGNGVIAGPVTVQSGGALAPGASLGTLTINNDLTLQGGLIIEVNKSLSPSNDMAAVSGVLANTGTGMVTVTNLGPALVVGDRFTLFNKPVQNGSALAISGGGVTWANNLEADGSISVASIGPAQKPLITSTVLSGNSLILSGTNGTAGGTYYVLSSTNLATPLASWAPESTNTFGPGGGFSVTNIISSGVPAKFYLLQLP